LFSGTIKNDKSLKRLKTLELAAVRAASVKNKIIRRVEGQKEYPSKWINFTPNPHQGSQRHPGEFYIQACQQQCRIHEAKYKQHH